LSWSKFDICVKNRIITGFCQLFVQDKKYGWE
jgi:hypothetical protein